MGRVKKNLVVFITVLVAQVTRAGRAVADHNSEEVDSASWDSDVYEDELEGGDHKTSSSEGRRRIGIT